MPKKSSDAILYTVLALLLATVLGYLWYKHSKVVTLASVQAAAAAGSATVPLTEAPISTTLTPPSMFTNFLTNTGAPL